MLVQPYLSFDGRCEEAIEFCRKALGAATCPIKASGSYLGCLTVCSI